MGPDRAPAAPPACTQPTGGRPETHPRRQIVDAIRYLVHNGCVWRALPTDFPPWPTVYGYFARWAADGTLGRVHDTLRQQVRQAHGRQPTPSAAIIDSQSVRAAETVPKPSRGLRRRQEAQRPQAPHRGGHPGAAAGRAGHRRQRPGP